VWRPNGRGARPGARAIGRWATPSLHAWRQALSRAGEFIEAHGGELDRLRRDVLFGRAPVSDLDAWFEKRQRDSGAIGPLEASHLAGSEPGLGSTLFALVVLADLRALRGPTAERAVAYLTGIQRDDGAFSPAPGAAESDVVVCTGMVAGYLARSRRARPAALDRAGAFLGTAFEAERVKGFAWQSLAAFAHFFTNVSHELSDPALQWCGRELERGYRSGGTDALRSVRVFTLCDAHSLPGARVDATELCEALLGLQSQDGDVRVGPEEASAERVGAALDAALAWVRFAPGDLREVRAPR
jgi:hypothetical protein